MGDRILVGLEGRGSGDKLGGVDGEKTIIVIYCLRKNAFSILKGVVLFVVALCI